MAMLAWASLAACGTPVKERTHKMSIGLEVKVPAEGWEIVEAGNTLTLRPADWRGRRTVEEIRLEVLDSEPERNFPNERKLENGVARYRIETAPGGSGGEEYTLTAWIALAGRYIVMQNMVQTEPPSQPNHDLAWRTLGSARWKR